MKLLISPRDVEEARMAVEGGADIIDIKNPAEGSLGASFPWVIRAVKKALPIDLELSATLGDLDGKPGFASLAATGISSLGVDYIKAGLLVKRKQKALELARSIVKAAQAGKARVVLAGYGDFQSIGSISPGELLEVALESGAYGVMIDTYSKNGASLFDHLSMKELKRFVDEGREQGLAVALAGSIKTIHIPALKKLNADIVGVRGAVCTERDRIHGKIEKEKVKEFKQHLLDGGRVV